VTFEEVLARYAEPDSGAWAEIGYDPYPLGPPGEAPAVERPPELSLAEVRGRYDVVVVGSGAGGGISAFVLASAGASVLVVERGRWLDRSEVPIDLVRNHRLPFGGDPSTPPGHPRALADPDGEVEIDATDFRYHLNAITAGGGTRFFGAQAWRFLPDDFRMATRYGIPDGSALADWPIGYDDLEPYYDRVEWELGVNGAPHPDDPPRQRGYPMAPFPLSGDGARLADAAAGLGWPTGPVPLLINTEPRNGRAACIRCGLCVGFPCPVDARNGVHSTVLPRAMAAGADLLLEASVARVTDDGKVEIVAGDQSRTVQADRILLAAGAVETARLLQLSRLGNDWVGDCLQGHIYTGAFGRFDEPVLDGLGPGPSIATRHFAHGNEGIVGGGLLVNEFVKIPTMFLFWALPPEVPRTGPEVGPVMAEAYRRTGHIVSPLQEIPIRSAQVRLSRTVVDQHGLPVARFDGIQHPEDKRGAAFLAARAEEWLQAAGAARTWTAVPPPMLSGGQHQAGTVRMAESPDHGATDPWGKVWGCDRVHVADASLHVTNGGANPVLTIMALAWRTAEHLVEKG
jgi:choline dehydrogenase-like flavoprotein